MNTRLRIREILLALTGGCVFFWVQPVIADNVNVKITGEIYIPPCKINGNDADIHVSFGKMALQEVNGSNNAVAKTVSVKCDNYQGTPHIRVSGTVLSGAGDNVLQTIGENSSTLGIALYQGGSVNTAFPLRIGAGDKGEYGYEIKQGFAGQNTQNGQFTFTAVPYKHGRGPLKAGSFSATATMSITYL